MAKQEVLYLNETLAAQSKVRPFDRLLSVESIRDRRLSEVFHQEDEKCAQQQQQECQWEFDAAMVDTLDKQRKLPFDQKLTSVMGQLIQKRLANVSDHLACEYNFKIELFRLSLVY